MERTPGVVFIGGARYPKPLNETARRKFLALAALGEIFVVGFSTDSKPRAFFEHAHFYLLPALPIPVLRYVVMLIGGPLLLLWCVLWRRARILIAQSPYEGCAAACVKILARLVGIRVVLIVESHGDFGISVLLQRRVLWPWFYQFIMRYAASFSLKHADVLRPVSDSTRRQLTQWAPAKPVIQFPAWTDIGTFLAAEGTKHGDAGQTVLFAGVLVPRKGIHHLINAFAMIAGQFPEARLSIVGHEENTAYAADLRERVDRLGLNGRVRFHADVSQRELAARMRGAHVVVLPSISEGLPRVVLEAMATGTPVIASRVSGIPEMVRDGETGFLVPAGDEAELSERLRWALQHRGETEAMGRRARAFAEGFFSTELYVEGYRRIVEAGRFLLAAQL